MIQTALHIGSTLPSFAKLQATDGKSYASADIAGARVLVVVFSCNHCPYVQAYEDRMVALQNEYGPRGVQLVAINANDTTHYPEDDFDGMVNRAHLKGFNFPYLRDDTQKVTQAFNATHTPEFFVFGMLPGECEMKLHYRGKMDDNHQDPRCVRRHYVREAIDALLEGKPAAEPETHSIGCTIKWKV